MEDIADPPFTPPEERQSRRVGFKDYLGKIAKAVLVTKGATIAGGLAGDRMGGATGAAWGAGMAGLAAAAYEGHEHWAPIKATQEYIAAALPEVQAELDPANTKEEIALQEQIKDGLQERQRLFTELVGKSKPATIQPRGKAVDALMNEAIIETKNPSRS